LSFVAIKNPFFLTTTLKGKNNPKKVKGMRYIFRDNNNKNLQQSEGEK